MNPLVILGWDAADPDLLLSWAKKGFLPTIASILEEGAWARLSGPEFISEHVVWGSFFSGISCGEHGYYYLRQLKPGSYELQTMDAAKVKIPPFWSFLKGRKVTIIDVPDNFPVEGLDGFQLGNWAVHNMTAPAWSEPRELLLNVCRRFGPGRRIEEKLNSTYSQDLRIFRDLMGRIKKKGFLCRYLLKENPSELTVITFGESHTATHQFWKYFRESSIRQVPAKNNRLHDAIRKIYQAIDQEMGQLLSLVPKNSNVFILSSTGMQDHYPFTYLIEDFCKKLGYLTTKNNSPVLRPIDLARGILPLRLRVAVSRLLSREKREGLLSDLFQKSTDWSKTTAFAIPSVFTSFIQVNLRGREPQGIVEGGAEYEALLSQLEKDLAELIDPQTGKPAVQEVKRSTRLFGKDASPRLPDLIVNWKPTSYFVDEVLHPKAVLTQRKPEFFRDNEHTQSGWIAAQGPNIKQLGALGDLSLLDLAPTFLRLMRESIPTHLHGRVIEEILDYPVP